MGSLAWSWADTWGKNNIWCVKWLGSNLCMMLKCISLGPFIRSNNHGAVRMFCFSVPSFKPFMVQWKHLSRLPEALQLEPFISSGLEWDDHYYNHFGCSKAMYLPCVSTKSTLHMSDHTDLAFSICWSMCLCFMVGETLGDRHDNKSEGGHLWEGEPIIKF